MAPPGVLASGVLATGASGGLSLWLIVRAFSAGCTAMTVVEVVSNGVPNFRDPAPRNVQRSLTYIVGILAKLLAQDNYLPHAFASRGRRLVYTSGIVALTLLAGLLLVVFGGVTDRLIPLFAIGAFLAFTLSQAGMVTHWRRLGKGGAPLVLNMVGAVATGVTLLVILVSKFADGAWATLVLVPALLLVFTLTRRHYDSVRVQVSTDEALDCSPRVAPVVIVPIQDWTAVTRKALRFAMKVGGDVRAVHV